MLSCKRTDDTLMIRYTGGCHCGEVKFSFISDNAVEIWKCNCSICSLIDYEHLFIPHEDFTLLSAQENLTAYSFGTHYANHYFCKTCGIKSFYQPRSHPEAYSVNLKCVTNPPRVERVVEIDGKDAYFES